MKKKAILYIVITPLLYLYGLAENHFHFGQTIRGYSLEFFYEYLNAWGVLFGRKYKDNSIKVSNYDFKVKSKKAKFDVEIALLLKGLYSSSWLRFNKKDRSLKYSWSSDYGEINLKVMQLGKDQFKIDYYNNNGWNNLRNLCTDYIFSKDEVINTLQTIKSIN